MKKIILPYNLSVVLFAIVLFVVGIQVAIHHDMRHDGDAVAKNVSCQVQTAVADDKKVVLKLDCQDRPAFTDNPNVVVSYVQHPGPFICTVYESGNADCHLPK